MPAELCARLRQLDWKAATFGTDEVIKIDALLSDSAGDEAKIGGRRIDLSHQELELLRYLAQHRGRVFTGFQYAGGPAPSHSRAPLAVQARASGELIETVRNVGYKLRG